MNAKEARKILAEGTDWDKNQWTAEGYLAALEGPEVKALLISLACCVRPSGAFSHDAGEHAKNCLEETMTTAKEALEEWRLENGLVKPSPEK